MITRRRIACLLLVAAGFAGDLWSKSAAFAAVSEVARAEGIGRDQATIIVFPGWLRFVTAENPGMAWSLLTNIDPRIWVVLRGSLAAALMVFWLRQRQLPAWADVGFALVVAGALGNLHDNCFADGGRVRDFVLFFRGTWRFPVFNMADALITCGAPLLFIWLARSDRPPAVPVAGAVA